MAVGRDGITTSYSLSSSLSVKSSLSPDPPSETSIAEEDFLFEAASETSRD